VTTAETRTPDDIGDLVAAPYNPRAISETAAAGLAKSLADFGDLSGIVWNAKTGRLVCGHQRVEQLRKLGGVYHDGAIIVGDGKRFQVRVVDWDEVTEKAANITANNKHLAGEYTSDLQGLLDEVKLAIGDDDFTDLRLDALISAMPVADPLESESDDEDDYELPEEPVTKFGDVWTLGGSTLICGDSAQHLRRGASVDCVFTDPPYGVNYTSRVDKERRKDWGPIRNDGLGGDSLRVFLKSTVPLAKFTYICCDYHTFMDFEATFGKPKSCIVWNKGSIGLGWGYRRQHEFILFYGAFSKTDGSSARAMSDVWDFARDSNYKHPTQKPTALAMKALIDCDATSVYDPFIGSGTTLLAAEKLGIPCTGIEIEPKYCDVVVQRWEELTGGSAVRKGG
jgi:hypothetical protein